MKFQISCHAQAISINKADHIYIDAADCSDLDDELFDFFRQNEWMAEYALDIMEDAIEALPTVGSFDNLYELGHMMYDNAKQISWRKNEIIRVDCQNIERNEIIHHIEISSAEVLKNIFDDFSECDNIYGDLCTLIDQKSMEFQSQGYWQWGFLGKGGDVLIDRTKWPVAVKQENVIEWANNGVPYFPILWFGLSEQPPQKPWILGGPNFDEEMLWFWQCDSDSAAEIIVPDFCDPYGMGYWRVECGCTTPDVEAIRSKCPIKLGINDSVCDILNRINQFFLDQFTLKTLEKNA